MTTLPKPSIHLITDRRRLSPDARTLRQETSSLERLIDEALDASVDVVQVRERDLEAGALQDLVARVVRRAAPGTTRVLVSGRADVAAASGAAGVHLPSRAMSAARVRAIGPDWIIGRAIHAGAAVDDGVATDYLMFGTVFESESKGPDGPVAGVDALATAVRAVGRPVVAIGGITPERVALCVAAGAAGVAAIGAFLPPGRAQGALGPRAAVEAFRRALKSAQP